MRLAQLVIVRPFIRPFIRSSVGSLVVVLAFAGLFACKPGKLLPPEVKDVVAVTVDSSGFSPDTIAAKRGRPLTLVFTRTSDKTCATEVLIPSERVRKELPLNQPTTVTFIPEKAGEVGFACAMNMVKGTISVAP